MDRIGRYDVLGRAVAVLVDDDLVGGRYERLHTADLAAGTYLVRMEAAGEVLTLRVAVIH